MKDHEIIKEFEELEDKINSNYRTQQLNKRELESKMECKIKNLQANIMFFVGVPLVMIVFSIILILMKIS